MLDPMRGKNESMCREGKKRSHPRPRPCPEGRQGLYRKAKVAVMKGKKRRTNVLTIPIVTDLYPSRGYTHPATLAIEISHAACKES